MKLKLNIGTLYMDQDDIKRPSAAAVASVEYSTSGPLYAVVHLTGDEWRALGAPDDIEIDVPARGSLVTTSFVTRVADVLRSVGHPVPLRTLGDALAEAERVENES